MYLVTAGLLDLLANSGEQPGLASDHLSFPGISRRLEQIRRRLKK